MSDLNELQTKRFSISLKGILNYSLIILFSILIVPLLFSFGDTHFRLRDTYWASLRSLFSLSFLLPIYLALILLPNMSLFRRWNKGVQVSKEGIESYEWSKTVVDPNVIKHIAALYSSRGKLTEIALGGSGVQKRRKDKLIIKYSGYQDMEGLLQAIKDVSPPDVSVVSLPRSETRKFNYVPWAILFGIIFVVIVLWVFTSRNFVIDTLIEGGSLFYFYVFFAWNPQTFGVDPYDEKLHRVFWQKSPIGKSEFGNFVGSLFVPFLLLAVLGPPIYREFVEGQTRICDRRFGCTHIVQLNGWGNGAMFLNDDALLVYSHHEIAKYDLESRRFNPIFHGEDTGGLFHDSESQIVEVVSKNGIIVVYLESGDLMVWGDEGDVFITSRDVSEFVEDEPSWNVGLELTENGRFLLLSHDSDEDELVVLDMVSNLNVVNRFADRTSLKLYNNDKHLEYNEDAQQIEIRSILDNTLLQIIPNVENEDDLYLNGSPHGSWLNASFKVVNGQDYARVWDAELQERLKLPIDLTKMEDIVFQFSPDGQYLAVGEKSWLYIEDEWVNRRWSETHLYKFDPEKGWQFHQRIVSQLGWRPAFSDDGTKLLYSSLDVFEVYDIKP